MDLIPSTVGSTSKQLVSATVHTRSASIQSGGRGGNVHNGPRKCSGEPAATGITGSITIPAATKTNKHHYYVHGDSGYVFTEIASALHQLFSPWQVQ